LLILAAVAASLSWWLSNITAPTQTVAQDRERFPDAYAHQLTVISYNLQGLPHYRLTTPKMQHYEAQDITELVEPVLWQFDQGKPPWKVQGQKAIFTTGDDTLFMLGHVQMDRLGEGKISPYHIATQNLKINTVTAYAETDQPIHFVGNNYQIEALGMHGWLQDPAKIKLLSRVRGFYEKQ
jgi:lipopolysaccharide export system protein LptC